MERDNEFKVKASEGARRTRTNFRYYPAGTLLAYVEADLRALYAEEVVVGVRALA